MSFSLKPKNLKNTLLISLVILVIPNLAAAAILPDCVYTSGGCRNLNDFVQLFINFAQYGLGIMAILTVFIIFNAGFMLILSAGNPEKINKSKSALSGALIGLLIILGSWVLVNTLIIILTGNPQGTIFGQAWYQLPGRGETECVGQEDGDPCGDNLVCVSGSCGPAAECDWWADHQPEGMENYQISRDHACFDQDEIVCPETTIVRGFCPNEAGNMFCCNPMP